MSAMPLPTTIIVSQNGIEAAATAMEITRNVRIIQGQLTLLTRVIVRCACWP